MRHSKPVPPPPPRETEQPSITASGVVIGNLPDWRYAGKHAETAVPMATRHVDGDLVVILPSSKLAKGELQGDGYETREYIIQEVKGRAGIVRRYLIPHYDPRESSYRRREEQLLNGRANRFFYSCEASMDAQATGSELANEISRFEQARERINQQRHARGLGDIRFDMPRSEMTEDERYVASMAAKLSGRIVNRMRRLGCVILQGNKVNVSIEFDDAYIKNHMAEIQEEFKTIYLRLAHSEDNLIGSMNLKNDKPDHEGVLADLVREMAKPVLHLINHPTIDDRSIPEDETGTRHNIVRKIAYTLEAIDELGVSMRKLLRHADFERIVNDLNARNAQKKHRLPASINEADFSAGQEGEESGELVSARRYRVLFDEFVETCRARACIKSEDAPNFGPVDTYMHYLLGEFRQMHASLFAGASYAFSNRGVHDHEVEGTIRMMKNTIELMSNMAELRMARNHRALTDLPEKDTGERFNEEASPEARATDEARAAEFDAADTSTTGQLQRRIEAWVAKHTRSRGR